MEKKLVKEVSYEGFNGKCNVNLIDNSYYTVEYKGKDEYFAKKEEIAFAVARVILFFYKNLSKGAHVFAKDIEDEIKWKELLAFLSGESKENKVAMDVCKSIYNSLESAYYDSLECDTAEGKKVLSTKSAIRNKDNLMIAIHRVTAMNDPSEALNNFRRYQKSRNKFIEENPQLELDIL